MHNIQNLVIIGSSAGGPRVLKTIFMGLPKLNGTIILVQHMPKFINESFAENLNDLTDMTVKIAENGENIESGVMYVAPSERHLELIDNKIINLYYGEKNQFVCPSVDVTMKSLKRDFGKLIVGIILTGMGSDGANGIDYLKTISGMTIAQDQNTSIIFGMPDAAIKTGKIDMILSPEQIKDKLIELSRKEVSF
jgi:two-component system chemotaxis response regulator CheB